jgi:ribosome-associated translation inhibitor RaiA
MPSPRKAPTAARASSPRAVAGRTPASDARLNVRTAGLRLDTATAGLVREKIDARLGKFAGHVERVTVRFADLNGPKGGTDKECHVQVSLSGMPTVIAEERATDLLRAFNAASHVAERGVRRAVERADFSSGPVTKAKAPARRSRRVPNAPPPGGAFIGKRVGQSSKDMGDVLSRPEKLRRDAYVDTSQPGVSATDRKAGGGSTARRNSRKNAPKATAALEDSATTPSRKSGRKSANRIKSASPMTVTNTVKVRSPSARAARRTGR